MLGIIISGVVGVLLTFCAGESLGKFLEGEGVETAKDFNLLRRILENFTELFPEFKSDIFGSFTSFLKKILNKESSSKGNYF